MLQVRNILAAFFVSIPHQAILESEHIFWNEIRNLWALLQGVCNKLQIDNFKTALADLFYLRRRVLKWHVSYWKGVNNVFAIRNIQFIGLIIDSSSLFSYKNKNKGPKTLRKTTSFRIFFFSIFYGRECRKWKSGRFEVWCIYVIFGFSNWKCCK